MKQVKFRAWEKNLEEIIPVHNIDFDRRMINTDSAWRMFDEIELMQWTELYDKNGKEIYEYDLVKGESYSTAMLNLWGEKVEEKSELYCIKYHEGSFKLFDNKDRWVAVLNHHLISKPEKFQVIGNVFEMPDWDF
jgi:uncharacterized phage protein (TIGR01671 family)